MIADFGFRIEEEVFINDASKRDAARSRTTDLLAACHEAFPGVRGELIEPQATLATPVCATLGEARDCLAGLRRGVGALAQDRGLAVMASGTHPIAQWTRVRTREGARGGRVMRDLQMVANRTVVCGLSVQVAVPDGVSRIDLMNRIQPYLPLLLALSTSSPFWQAQRTGLLGYRLAAARELPRSGLPELFADEADYARYLDALVAAGAIEDASQLWWVVRPASREQALELRVADSCTRLEDTLAIAALYRCLVRRLSRDRALNRGMTSATHALVAENCWRAQRYGIHGSFLNSDSSDPEEGAPRPVKAVLDAALALVAEDAAALGCAGELDLARWIMARGTSADRQLALHTEAQGRGLSGRDALVTVVDWLTAETVGASPTRH